MLGFQGPAQPSPALGDALNGGYPYLEVKCLGCETHQTVALKCDVAGGAASVDRPDRDRDRKRTPAGDVIRNCYRRLAKKSSLIEFKKLALKIRPPGAVAKVA